MVSMVTENVGTTEKTWTCYNSAGVSRYLYKKAELINLGIIVAGDETWIYEHDSTMK